MFKIKYGELCGLYREAAYRGHPYAVVRDAIAETATLGTMVQRIARNRHVKEHTPIVFNSLFYGCPSEIQATE